MPQTTIRRGLTPIGADTHALALPANANVSDELGRVGIALGDLVLRTGNAVAETQRALNATSAATASALATTLVDVIAVQEKVYRDDGSLDNVISHTRQLPLINFIDPVFYEWTSVRLQGQFSANEFVSASSASSSSSSSGSAFLGAGVSFFLGPGALAINNRSSSSTNESTTATDVSFGRVRMHTLLQPRRDIGVPKPAQVIQGPRLTLIEGDIQDVLTASVLTARTMSVLIEYHRRDGTAIQGKSISIETEGVAWSFADPTKTTTDANGRIEIRLRREFLDPAADTSPKEFVVTGRIGLVSNAVTVTF